MTVIEWIETIAIVVITLAVVIYYIVKGVKNKWYSKLLSTMNEAMAEAEKTFKEPGSGETKKNFVITKIKEKCNELGIPYNLIKSLIDKAIDASVSAYNAVKGK